MSIPPPYYESTTTPADNTELTEVIKQLSNKTVNIDKKFYELRVVLERDGLTDPGIVDEWRDIHKIYTELLWASRKAATQVGSYNRDFVDVIIPTLADMDETVTDKIAELEIFINRDPPKLLTTTEATEKIEKLTRDIKAFSEKHYQDGEAQIANENGHIAQYKESDRKQKEEQERASHSGGLGRLLGFSRPPPVELIDYDSKIKQAQDRIVAIAEQQEEVKQKAIDVLESLDGVAERVGSSFAMVWTHLNTDAGHIKRRMEQPDADPFPDISAAGAMYTRIKAALNFYATNIDKSGN